MPNAKSQLSGIATLLLSATIWGFAFVAQRAGMEFVGPFTFNGIRFALGALVLVPTAFLVRRRSTPAVTSTPQNQVWMAAGLAGLVLFVSANLQQAGLVHTTAGKAGFI
ncbi:DMT family transporter, partial [Candidatus Bipolaricaulota bacterium]|nr:DMT family transporter [Candidatus Bipolaricaulota bacterium]